MNLYVYNKDFINIGVLDIYKSLIWTDRYYECGDFEVFTSASTEMFELCQEDFYILNDYSNRAMIIEEQRLESDVEDGDKLTISGRSLESILSRRIIWKTLSITGNLQNGIKKLLDECIISPTDTSRKIPNFIFKASTNEYITGLTIDAQYTGDNLYDVIKDICTAYEIGFSITFDENMNFVFELYHGEDRTYDQVKNPHVAFSPKFDNLINSNFLVSKSIHKNVTLIGGEGEGPERKYTTVDVEGYSGLDRREMFTDARDISSRTDDGGNVTDDDYTLMLEERGLEKLIENMRYSSFDGQTETGMMFVYNNDYFMGDIVSIADDYGHDAYARITEFIISEDDSGFFQYPSFELL